MDVYLEGHTGAGMSEVGMLCSVFFAFHRTTTMLLWTPAHYAHKVTRTTNMSAVSKHQLTADVVKFTIKRLGTRNDPLTSRQSCTHTTRYEREHNRQPLEVASQLLWLGSGTHRIIVCYALARMPEGQATQHNICKSMRATKSGLE